ncbi:protease inhibitor I42 family protein [Pseudomonas sp. R5(2019)]|uniref:protease inhibitor I42 family protein n=1 Tax=Pseudomonas sp. R5(2019) TaxID=2697566 RepID=UPI00141206D2|nr:protease inhibitor I42 family protein [Pseudomonas sp. R5(2019)]NBA94540.1 peptidase inhibitor I42 [Pseudomonas sp. R5(2019)]
MPTVRLLVPLSLTLLAACASTPPQNVDLHKQSQCPMPLHVGQKLTLTLPSNPTTGFRWLVQNPAGSILRSLSPEVYTNPEDAGLVGSGGQSVWRFQAQNAGEGHLLLVYQQPWAPEVRPAETFDCAISVK